MLRDPNSIPESDTIIEDPVLEPFFITNSQNGGYTVYERIEKSSNKKTYIRTVGYPSTFNHALKIVAKEKLNLGEKSKFTTIKEYVDKWESITKSIENTTTISI